MNIDKYDFILHLLNNKKLSLAQRERVLTLTYEEIKKDKAQGVYLEDRVVRIEEHLNISFLKDLDNISDIHKNNITEKDTPLSKYYYPSSMYKYLFDFNQNRILKSTCHEIDSDALSDILDYCETKFYDFNIHLNKIINAFEQHDQRFCIKSTKSLIRGYITGTDYYNKNLQSGWSSDKVQINWSNDLLLNWALKNKVPPNLTQSEFKKLKLKSFVFDGFTSNIFGKRVQTFRELVLHFKSLFHIRSDNPLLSILTNVNNHRDYSDKIDFFLADEPYSRNIELFTDVDKLIQGYIKIIELIIDKHTKGTKPIVNLSFYEKGDNVYLSIHHLNNTYKKSINSTIERLGQTYTLLINNQLNGMCNLYLKADFGNDVMAEVNLWNGKIKYANRNNLEDFTGGVEHILEFCKK